MNRIALVPLLLLLLLGGASASCPPTNALRISIDSPARVAAANSFSAKVTITNQGTTSVGNLAATVYLPVQTTALKVSPASVVPAPGNSPWTLLLPALALPPGKSETIKIRAVVGQAFQGSFDLMASVAVPTDPLCTPVVASRTVRGRANRGLNMEVPASFRVN